MKHLIQIPIGDYEGTGHKKCDWFTVESNMPLQDVFKAYFKARDTLPKDVCPEYICKHRDEQIVYNDILKKLNKQGFNTDWLIKECKLGDLNNKPICAPRSEHLIEIVLWFIKKGNPDLELNIVDIPEFINENIEQEENSKEKSIGHIGYGIF
jgi:hypothetical protein